MKLAIAIVAMLAGTMLLTPKQSNIAGTWVLETDIKKSEASVLRIQMREGYFVGLLDEPEQQVFDRPVSIHLNEDSVKIMLDERGACFIQAVVTDTALVGSSFVSGHITPLRFCKAKNSQ